MTEAIGKKFQLPKPVNLDRLKNLEKYAGKLEKLVKEKDAIVNDLRMIQLEDRVHQEEELTENISSDLKHIWRSMKTDNLKSDSISLKSSSLASENLDITTALTNQKLAAVMTQSAVSSENLCVKSWKIVTVPLAGQPDIKLRTTFKTIQSNEKKDRMPSITGVRFKVVGLAENNDLAPAIAYCQAQSDIQLFTRLLEDYLTINADREELIEKSLGQPSVNHKGKNILEFKNSEGKVLVYLCLHIAYHDDTLDWAESWSCKFTEAGISSGEQCNIPNQLIRTGSYADWNVAYAIETLSKMASLDAPTPHKQDSISESELGSEATPLNSQSRRAPKRRLN